MHKFMIAALLLVSACTSIPESTPMETGATTSVPLGCVELRKREGPDAC